MTRAVSRTAFLAVLTAVALIGPNRQGRASRLLAVLNGSRG
ncbi:hypothetical protein ABZS98_39435 [Streptomyces avermitilis]